MKSLLFALLAVCFFVSGAAGLLYEVVWMRLLGLTFGHTTWAVTTVLAAFMGGLALGSFLLGRWADRVRRLLLAYGLIEALVGLYCLSTPILFKGADALYSWLHRSLEPSAVPAGVLQLTLSAALIVPPTALMGSTLPILSRVVVHAPGRAGSQVGTLYAINTWGAVAGTAATGYWLLPTIGMRHTVWLGVGLNLAAAVLALLIFRSLRYTSSDVPAPHAGPPLDDPMPAGPSVSRKGALATLVAIGVSGAASMAYEIAWTRALSLVLGSSTYAFSAMLTTFLAGLALGAFAAARLSRRFRLGLLAFGLVESGVAIVALALLPAFGELPVLVLRILGAAGLSHGSALLAQFAASFLVMIVPTLLVGATLPLAIHVLSRDVSRLGKDVGAIYGVNTVGSIAGSIAAGFVLIPLVGVHDGIMVAAAANLTAGVLVLLLPEVGRRGRWASVFVASIFVVLAVAIPPWDGKLMTSGVSIYASDYLGEPGGEEGRLRAALASKEELLYAEGVNTTVAVDRVGTILTLTVNGKGDASNGVDMMTQLLLGHLPALARPDARRALVIGLGSGVTAGALAQHPLESIDVAELEPAVVAAASFFARENHDVLADRRVKLIAGDGRHVLAGTSRPYDIIVSEPSNPWIAGVGNLFTAEFYESAKQHLAPDGVMVQWLHGYSIFPREMRMVTRTFQEVFPHVTIWRCVKGDYILVGSPRRLELDFDAIRRRFAGSPGLRQDFAPFRTGPEDLLYHFVLGEEGARAFGEGAPRNTDDLPLLEFAAPAAMYFASVDENDRLLRSSRRERFPPARGLDVGRLTSPAGLLESARARWLLGDGDDALRDLAGMGSPAGLPVELRAARARLLFALGRVGDAVREFDDLSRRGPGDAQLAAYLRASRVVEGSRDLATRLERVASSSATFQPAKAYEDIAWWCLITGSNTSEQAFFAIGAEYLEEALRIEPRSPETLDTLGNAYLELGRSDDAIRTFRKLLDQDPGRFQAHFNVGLAYERAGRIGEAMDAYSIAGRLAPGWEPAREKVAALKARKR